MTKLTMQSIDLLGQQPAKVHAKQKEAVEYEREPPSTEKSREISEKEAAKAEVKPALTKIMEYQGINEQQMQEALKILEE